MAALHITVFLEEPQLGNSFKTIFQGAAGTADSEDIVTDQLYWHVDAANSSSYSGSGTTWTDLISGQNATLVNGPTYSKSGTYSGGAFFFNGVDEHATTSYQKNQDAFSVSAWIKPSTQNDSSPHAIVNQFENGSAEWWALEVQGGDRGKPAWIVDNNSVKIVLVSDDQSPNSWQMLTGTRSGASMKLYLNTSVLKTSTSLNTSTVVSLEPFQIANSLNGEYFKGYISDIKIYTKELSSSEVTQNYNALKDRYGL